MADYSDRFGGKHLNATHVTAPFVGIVERVELEDVDGQGKRKPVVYFDGRDRGCVLNSTRYDVASNLAGSRDTDQWVGTKIRVSRGQTRFGGKPIACVEFGPVLERELNDSIPGWN
jgi:hypothetical protein